MPRRHHARLVLVANRSTIDSVWKHQRALPHGRAGSRGGVVRDGCRKACAHYDDGSTKLIAQVINGFGNSRVIFKAKILMHLAIMRISDIIVINDITDIKIIKRIKRMKS